MPTISQLPAASTVSAADEVPISQDGAARAASIGALLASAQSVITLESPSLLGRSSLGSGGPEQVDIGTGLTLTTGSLAADGLDHAGFAPLSSLSSQADLVISNQGTPMLMQTALLRGLFSAGQDITIDSNGVISAAVAGSGATLTAGSIENLPVITQLASQDLLAANHSGSTVAISYSNFLDGVTIDQAQTAAAASDTDTTWVAQGSNTMTSQSFAAIWAWIAAKLTTYQTPVIEVTVNTTLSSALHNGHLLICSQPLTLSPEIGVMGNGFNCTVINTSTGNLTLGPGFVTSNGSLSLAPWQSAVLLCATYTAGTIAFAVMPPPEAGTSVSLPGQILGLANSALTSSTISLSWQSPSSGGSVSFYIVQYRLTGATAWTNAISVSGTTVCQITGLQAAASYDIIVLAQNAAGTGTASSTLTVVTAAEAVAPPQVAGVTAGATSSSAIQLAWSAQTGSSAATSFTVQYRLTGASSWTSTITGISGTGTSITGLQAATSYDFEVMGVNGDGSGTASSVVSATTSAASSQSVTSITWNLLPSGVYTHGTNSVAINAHISPASSPVQFGFSQSATTPPTSWTAAAFVSSDIWGAYLATPSTSGSWYVWGEGLDGSALTVEPTPFTVQ